MLKTEQCHECGGHGVIGDYGNGEDFYGPKECPTCKGSGSVPARDKQGRFVKHADDKSVDA